MTKYCYLLTSYHFDMCKVWMLIPGKSHFRVNSRNSWVSIETLDFAWVSCVIGVGSPRCKGGGAIASQTRRGSWPMMGPHCRLWMIDIAGGVAPKTAGGGYAGSATREAQWPSVPGNHCPSPPHRTPLDNRSTSRAGWAHEMALVPGVGCQAVNNRLHSLATDLVISLSR